MQHLFGISEPDRGKFSIRTEKPRTIVSSCRRPVSHWGANVMGPCRFVLVAAALVLTTVVAGAADPMPTPAYPVAPVMPVVYDWTGFYVGGHVGGGWAGRASGGFRGGASGLKCSSRPVGVWGER